MAIILQGDRAKAATWVPWAKNQLQRLKSISSVVNQIYRPAVGVGIHVRSGAGIDWIRVVAAGIVGCRNNFEQVSATFPLPFETGFVNNHWVDNKKQLNSIFIYNWYLFGDGQAQLILGVGNQRDHTYPSAGDFSVILYSIKRTFNDDVINLTSFSITNTEATFIIDTGGSTKALGVLTFLLSAAFLDITGITVTIDGVPVEIITAPTIPTRNVNIIIPTASGGIMTAVITRLAPTARDDWMVIPGWFFIKYKCLATKTKTITVT